MAEERIAINFEKDPVDMGSCGNLISDDMEELVCIFCLLWIVCMENQRMDS